MSYGFLLCHSVIYGVILYYSVSYCIVLCHFVLYCTIFCHMVSYCIIIIMCYIIQFDGPQLLQPPPRSAPDAEDQWPSQLCVSSGAGRCSPKKCFEESLASSQLDSSPHARYLTWAILDRLTFIRSQFCSVRRRSLANVSECKLGGPSQIQRAPSAHIVGDVWSVYEQRAFQGPCSET